MKLKWHELQPVVTYATYIKCRSEFQFGPRIIFEHQFIYIVKGKGIAHIQGRKYDIKEGDLFYYGPDVAHLFQADSESPFEMVAMHFEFIGDIIHDALRRPIAKDIRSLKDVPNRDNRVTIGDKGLDELVISDYISTLGTGIGTFMVHIAHQYRLNNSMSAMMNRGMLLYSFKLLHNAKHQTSAYLSPQDQVLVALKTQLTHEAEGAYQRKWLTQWSGYNEDYIARRFREKFGVSPHEFHLLQKIELAKDFIDHSQKTMTEISEKLHFSSLHVFSKVFRKFVGQSPMKYKKNQVALHDM
jgi:AraC-like DNA-binding protein